jgi:superfamily II DNA or RNA helicase
MEHGRDVRLHGWPSGREILYVVDLPGTMQGLGLMVELARREPRRDGRWSKAKPLKVRAGETLALPDAADRKILALLLGPGDLYGYHPGCYSPYSPVSYRYRLSGALQETLIPLMCQTGRCVLRAEPGDEEMPALRWDDGTPWECWLEARRDPSGTRYIVTASLRRGDERLALSAPLMLAAGGLVFTEDRVARLDDSGVFPCIVQWRQHDTLMVPVDQGQAWLEEMLSLPRMPRLDLPEALRYEEVRPVPRPRLRVETARDHLGDNRLRGDLSFDYDGTVVPADRPGPGILQVNPRRVLLRDPDAERAAGRRLTRLGFREQTYYLGAVAKTALALAPRHLPHVVRTLLETGWEVEAEGRLYRRPGAIRIEVSSGVDWFDLHGRVDFDGAVATLPELLAALRRGENAVRLGDGTFGILPEEWLNRCGVLAGFGVAQDGHLRFRRSQVGLLDALLASQPEATCDEAFARARDELRRFDGIAAVDPPPGFTGELRPYQREGVGWLHFLRRFGFGGCLADDMGLGKTVMVLALLESRREQRERPGPSLVVVPRSLVFNWKQEAARFTPRLRVLDHTGVDRGRRTDHFDGHDLVITTYGTLRRDAALFRDVRFDYVILDEAQAIKNAETDAAKAARLLQGDHRLALSGTPVENHLGELWSLFEFLNPGMLGAASAFRGEGALARNPDEHTRRLLARALRPFILRRTKDQVARDLPRKVEQTLYCELELPQRALYDELREHYRRSLLDRIARDGIDRAKIQILEALLRLRQAACHPGLLDRARIAEPSAKIDLLLPRLAEVLDEGHKALVFSQFTSLLAIVRERLDRERVRYAYLDGRTRDRATAVQRFQRDPDCRLFLVSLRAGGLGLNLTAADYVFLLDPWWNPAVEAQAIDRSHRIGQTRQVFAYRLIARGTIEEKILELQRTKRELADAIISADNSVIRGLTREDLELLLA